MFFYPTSKLGDYDVDLYLKSISKYKVIWSLSINKDCLLLLNIFGFGVELKSIL